MAETVTLEQLEKTLFGTYRALKKRALAMIHNEAIVEAADLVKRFMGCETDPELLVFSRMVLQKLQDFSAVSGNVNPESLAALLESPEPSRRILALRALLGRRSAAIPELLRRQCASEHVPEAVALVAENLRHNPDPGNLPFLERFLNHSSPRVRSEGYRGILALISGTLLPLLLRGLSDPAPELQMLVRQMASQFDRRHLIEATSFLLGSDLEAERRQGALVIGILNGNDFLPLLRNHLAHADPDTRKSVRDALAALASRGNAEAGALLAEAERPSVPAGDGPDTEASSMISPAHGPIPALAPVLQRWPEVPAWLVEPAWEPLATEDPGELIDRVRKIHDRVRDFLSITCICSYFLSGRRNLAADRVCFRGLQHGVTSVNTISFLKLLGPSLPALGEEGALFPSRLAACLVAESDEAENLCEPFEALAEGFRLLEDYPEEASSFVSPALDSLGSMLARLAPVVGGDRIVVKLASAEAVRIFDVLKSSPMVLDPRLFANFPLPVEAPILLSADSTMSVPLTPFFGVSRDRVRLLRIDPDERGLSEFFHRCGAHEGFLGFLGENR